MRSRSALVLGGALGNILDRVALRLCRRLRRSAFRRVAAVFGLQCRRRGDYHRRAAFACPRAPDARSKARTDEGSLNMRMSYLAPGRVGRRPARRLRRRRPVQPRPAGRIRRRAQRAAGRAARFRADPAAPGRGRCRRRSARPGAAGAVRRPAPRSAVENNLLQRRRARPRRARRPLGRRRSGDHGGQSRRAGPDDPAAARRATARKPRSPARTSVVTPAIRGPLPVWMPAGWVRQAGPVSASLARGA